MYLGIKLRSSIWTASTFIPSTFLDIIFAKIASNFLQSNRVGEMKAEMLTRLTVGLMSENTQGPQIFFNKLSRTGSFLLFPSLFYHLNLLPKI